MEEPSGAIDIHEEGLRLHGYANELEYIREVYSEIHWSDLNPYPEGA